MNNSLPINYTKADVKNFFLGIGAEQTWVENVKVSRMNHILCLIWDRRNSIKWSDIPAEFKAV